jgi:DNA gyrase subunit A
MVVVQAGDKDTAELLSVTESGLGKRTLLSEYPLQGRGGQGVIGHKLTDRTGTMVSLSQVLGTEELFVLSEQGDLIRTSTSSVSVYGRSSQGVSIKKVDGGDKVVAAMVLPAEEELAKVDQ